MPDAITGFLRGLVYIIMWALMIVWCIGAPVIGILLSSYLLQHPAQRILIPLSLIVTVFVTIKGAQLLLFVGERALEG
ncbi:MAG: hypothetical protein M1296_07095 [Chloroflexi bacterium]|nr:hypothetical protein [Chloroflexota bacterium]